MKTGQKVVYVEKNLPEIGLIKNNIYEILDIAECGCTTHIDVGLFQIPGNIMTVCANCGNIINLDDRWFFDKSGFRPVVEASQLVEEKINLALE